MRTSDSALISPPIPFWSMLKYVRLAWEADRRQRGAIENGHSTRLEGSAFTDEC